MASGLWRCSAAVGHALALGAAVALVVDVCEHLTFARVAEGLGVSWNTANDAV